MSELPTAKEYFKEAEIAECLHCGRRDDLIFLNDQYGTLLCPDCIELGIDKLGFKDAVEMVYRSGVYCPYCNKKAELVTGKEIYPHRRDLYNLKFYQCEPCGAYVGTHKNSEAKPLGRLANKELRAAKKKAHAAFDPIWRTGEVKRKDAYMWLANELEITFGSCHIGMFDLETCRKVVRICADKKRISEI